MVEKLGHDLLTRLDIIPIYKLSDCHGLEIITSYIFYIGENSLQLIIKILFNCLKCDNRILCYHRDNGVSGTVRPPLFFEKILLANLPKHFLNQSF